MELPRLDEAKLAERGPIKCHVTGTVKNPHLQVEDASLVIHLPEHERPVLDVDAIDLDINVKTIDEIPMLVTDPFTVFDRQEFTAEMNDALLGLVVPTLHEVADVDGKVSLTLDTVHIPLDVSQDELVRAVELKGHLLLHDVSTTVKTPLLSALIKVLADLYNKKPSEVVRIAKDADVRFELKNGQLYHEGLQIGFPDISPELTGRSSGFVGVDGALNLILEVPAIMAQAAGTRNSQDSDYLRFKVTGTLKQPMVAEIVQP